MNKQTKNNKDIIYSLWAVIAIMGVVIFTLMSACK
jgi:hypothetical protein